MGRPLRIEVPDGIFHVFARGNDKKLVFTDSEDYRRYLRMLARVVQRHEWQLLGFCLMPNHVHLLVQTPNANLSMGMHALQSAYARTFNERHGRVGHVFQGRFGSKHVQGDAQFWVTTAYIAANPVEAGLCDDPGGWVWSSHGYVMGRRRPPDWLACERLLHVLGADENEGRVFYDRLISDRLAALAA